jgi:hypothetical protein
LKSLSKEERGKERKEKGQERGENELCETVKLKLGHSQN